MPKNAILERFSTHFSYDLLIQLGEKAALRAMRIWARTGLPEPQEGEYVYGENGITVPLNRSGIALVFRSRSEHLLQRHLYESSLVRDDNILQPLYRRALDNNACFEVRPGIKRVGATVPEIQKIESSLKESGLALRMREAGFMGLLPMDERALVVANTNIIKSKRKAAGSGTSPRQDKIYGALSAQITDAISSASTRRIADMFALCRDITARQADDPEKILHASWTNRATLGPDKERIVASASAYDRKLANYDAI